jgi:DNA topoisomerase I
MARSLVIVESPAKAKTINKYLGRNFTVKASIGHVMDLPKKTIGIRLPGEEEGGKKKKRRKTKKASKNAKGQAAKLISINDDKIFEPTLQIIAGKGKVINDLRKAAHSAEAVYLAGDPDREGEAISAHLALVLSKPSKFVEQEPSVSRFKKKEAAPEEPAKKEEENGSKKEVVAIDPKKIFRNYAQGHSRGLR